MSQPCFDPICSDTLFRPVRRLPHRTVANETVVVDAQRRKVFSLNAVAATVWSAVERGDRHAEIVAAVVREFRVEEPQARRDVDAFLGRLEVLGLVVRAAAAGQPE